MGARLGGEFASGGSDRPAYNRPVYSRTSQEPVVHWPGLDEARPEPPKVDPVKKVPLHVSLSPVRAGA